MCNFVISWFCDIVVDRSWWSTNLWFRDFVTSSYGTVMIGMSWLIQPWPQSNLRSCKLRCCSWGPMTWNRGFMLFETKLAGIDTFRCLEYRLQVLNKVSWFFIDNVNLLESVFGKHNSWPILRWPNEFEPTFGGNQNSLNGSVNWSDAVWGCQCLFPVTFGRWRLHRSIGCCFVS